MPDSAIQVDGLIRDFKNGIRAVDRVDLEVASGEVFGFLGPNGAGKSTVVLMLTTLLAPTDGTARVGGFDVVREGGRARATLGAALQQAALDPYLTAREHLRFQAGLHGLSRREAAARAAELLEQVELGEAADRKAGAYSGGMKRRLDLALALVHRPRVLFLDEPTTGLDIRSRSALWDEIQRLARDEGVTVFLTTQYLEEADMLAHRVAIIDRGRIVALGTPEELKSRIGSSSVEAIPQVKSDRAAVAAVLARFGEPAAASPGGAAVRVRQAAGRLADIVRAVDREGLRISDLHVHAPTLDDVFLAETGRSLEAGAQA